MASPPADLLTARSGRVKAARRLARRVSRAEHRLFLAEGGKALSEALQVPGCLVEVFATPAAGAEQAALRAAVEAAGIPWWSATEDAVAGLAGAVTPQGLVAVCRFLDRPLADVLDRAPADAPVVVAANVRDPGNAGTIIRTADASGAGAVVLAGESVDPYNDKVVRSTVGSLFHLPLAVEPDPLAVIEQLRGRGFRVLAADGAGEVDLFDADALLAGPVAWVFGNEAWGLPEELARAADQRVSIPIPGRAESLNLATAAAVCLYASLRARRSGG